MKKVPIKDGVQFLLTGPFDAHVHLRQKKNGLMQIAVPDLTHEFGGALVMCNTDPPITNLNLALSYSAEIGSLLPPDSEFKFVYTCYLTDKTDGDEVVDGFKRGIWGACKYMPNNGSTNTARALTSFEKGFPVYEKMEEAGIPLLLHAETVGDGIDPFDAPNLFLGDKMPRLRKHFPALTVVLEHITTKNAADYIRNAEETGEPTYATITPQHLLFSRSRIFQRTLNGKFIRGFNPSMVCWPLLQKENPDRRALLDLVASGSKRVGLGTDRAPHDWLTAKACEDGCGGCYPGRLALPMYAMAFEEIGSFEHFQDFACCNIPCGVYKLPKGQKRVRLVKCAENPSVMPEMIGEKVKPMMHGEKIPWRLEILSE